MKSTRLYQFAAIIFMLVALVFMLTGNTGTGAAFIAIGAVFLALGQTGHSGDDAASTEDVDPPEDLRS